MEQLIAELGIVGVAAFAAVNKWVTDAVAFAVPKIEAAKGNALRATSVVVAAVEVWVVQQVDVHADVIAAVVVAASGGLFYDLVKRSR